MYSREKGFSELAKLKNSLKNLGEYDYDAIATVSLKFDFFGRKAIEIEDLNAFHSAQRIASLKTIETSKKYQIDVRCKNIRGQKESNDMNQIGAAIAKGYNQARIILIGLSASARCLILRRHLTFSHDEINVSIPSQPHLRKAEFLVDPLKVEGGGAIHAGNLWGAIKTLAIFESSWSEAFLHNYESGQMFLLAPVEFDPLNSDGSFHFLSEAYLSFFRCLEYIVMAQVLRQRGQFKGHHLRRAFEKLKWKSSDGCDPQLDVLKIHANDLIRKRGQYAAHLLVGGKQGELSHQDVYNLKDLVDVLFCSTIYSMMSSIKDRSE